jgi:hypothetical protein
MSLYSFIVSIHVVVAILGIGPLMALALLTRRPPLQPGISRPMPPEPALKAFLRLLRLSQISLGLMLGTGATLVAMVHGVFGRQAWMMVSVVLFLLVGAGTGLAQVYFKTLLTPAGAIVHVERAHRILLSQCALVATIAWLMEAKPF